MIKRIMIITAFSLSMKVCCAADIEIASPVVPLPIDDSLASSNNTLAANLVETPASVAGSLNLDGDTSGVSTNIQPVENVEQNPGLSDKVSAPLAAGIEAPTPIDNSLAIQDNKNDTRVGTQDVENVVANCATDVKVPVTATDLLAVQDNLPVTDTGVLPSVNTSAVIQNNENKTCFHAQDVENVVANLGLSEEASAKVLKEFETFIELAREKGLSEQEIVLLSAELQKMLMADNNVSQLVVNVKQTTGMDVIKWGVVAGFFALAMYAIVKLWIDKKDEEASLTVTKKTGNRWQITASNSQVADIVKYAMHGAMEEKLQDFVDHH